MANANIRITGIDETVAKVRRLGGSTRGSVLKGAVYLRGVLSKYPERKRLTRKQVYGQTFQSRRQRNFFFAALRDGRIQVPYVRTRNLGHRWAVKAESDTRARVGNNAPYARQVMDEDYPQSKFMQALGWKTAQAVARAERANVIRLIAADLKAQLRQLRGRQG